MQGLLLSNCMKTGKSVKLTFHLKSYGFGENQMGLYTRMISVTHVAYTCAMAEEKSQESYCPKVLSIAD